MRALAAQLAGAAGRAAVGADIPARALRPQVRRRPAWKCGPSHYGVHASRTFLSGNLSQFLCIPFSPAHPAPPPGHLPHPPTPPPPPHHTQHHQPSHKHTTATPLVPLTAHGVFGTKPAPTAPAAGAAASGTADARPPFKVSTNSGAAALAPLPLSVSGESPPGDGLPWGDWTSHGSGSIVDDSAALSLSSSARGPGPGPGAGGGGDGGAASASSLRARAPSEPSPDHRGQPLPQTAQEKALARARQEHRRALAHAALLERHRRNQRRAADRYGG